MGEVVELGGTAAILAVAVNQRQSPAGISRRTDLRPSFVRSKCRCPDTVDLVAINEASCGVIRVNGGSWTCRRSFASLLGSDRRRERLSLGERMLVDPEILRAFAGETARTADEVAASQLGGDVPAAFAGMPGSTSAWMAQSIEGFVSNLVRNLSEGFDGLATASRGGANTFQVTDDDLAGAIDRVLPR